MIKGKIGNRGISPRRLFTVTDQRKERLCLLYSRHGHDPGEIAFASGHAKKQSPRETFVNGKEQLPERLPVHDVTAGKLQTLPPTVSAHVQNGKAIRKLFHRLRKTNSERCRECRMIDRSPGNTRDAIQCNSLCDYSALRSAVIDIRCRRRFDDVNEEIQLLRLWVAHGYLPWLYLVSSDSGGVPSVSLAAWGGRHWDSPLGVRGMFPLSIGYGGGQGFGQAGGGFLLFAELGFEVVEEGHQVVDLGNDAFLLGQGGNRDTECLEVAQV